MEITKGKFFPTIIYHIKNTLEEKHINDIRKYVIDSYNEDPYDNWQSDPGLHKHEELNPLSDKIVELGKYVFGDLKYVYDKFEITDMWANVSKDGEFHKPHTHLNNILSGVFYVKSNQSANINFLDPRPGANVLSPAMREYNNENSNICGYPSIENTMLLFPSWLQHYVPENSDRISISFNLMLKGIIGDETSFQSAKY